MSWTTIYSGITGVFKSRRFLFSFFFPSSSAHSDGRLAQSTHHSCAEHRHGGPRIKHDPFSASTGPMYKCLDTNNYRVNDLQQWLKHNTKKKTSGLTFTFDGILWQRSPRKTNWITEQRITNNAFPAVNYFDAVFFLHPTWFCDTLEYHFYCL